MCRPSPRIGFYSEKAQFAKKAVPVEHCGIDRRVMDAFGKELRCQDQADHRVPPGGMIEVYDERRVFGDDGRDRLARQTDAVEIPSDVSLAVPGEPFHQPPRHTRNLRFHASDPTACSAYCVLFRKTPAC